MKVSDLSFVTVGDFVSAALFGVGTAYKTKLDLPMAWSYHLLYTGMIK